MAGNHQLELTTASTLSGNRRRTATEEALDDVVKR